MSTVEKRLIAIPGAQLDFYCYPNGNATVIEFDSRGCGCPVPMVHAMLGLERITQTGERLAMINGFEPEGLYPRIAQGFEWSVEPFEDGVRIIFTAKAEAAGCVDFSNNRCRGS